MASDHEPLLSGGGKASPGKKPSPLLPHSKTEEAFLSEFCGSSLSKLSDADLQKYFSDTYPEAASKFEDAAKKLAARRLSFYEKVRICPDRFKPEDPKEDCNTQFCTVSLDTNESVDKTRLKTDKDTKLIVVSSGVHGVEGYAGSAIQLMIMERLANGIDVGSSGRNGPENSNSASTLCGSSTKNTILVLVHAVNPYGMKYNRRWNENNVDLNRNALTNEQLKRLREKDQNQVFYDKLDPLLNPTQPPTWFYCKIWIWFRIVSAVLRHGIVTLKKAMVGATYQNEKGVFYGGKEVQKSHTELKNFFESRFGHTISAKNVFWCDVHTGLGPSGIDVILPHSASVDTNRIIENMFPAVEGKCAGVQHGKNKGTDAIIDERCGPVEGRGGESSPPAKKVSETVCSPPSAAKKAGGLLSRFRMGTKQMEGYDATCGVLTRPDWLGPFFAPDSGDPLCFTQEFGTRSNLMVARALVIETRGYFWDTRERHRDVWSLYTRDVFHRDSDSRWKKRVLEGGNEAFRKMWLYHHGNCSGLF